MFKYATGWLGWSPEVAEATPFPVIELALDGKVEFLIATTPGAKKPPQKPRSGAELRERFKAAFGLSRPGA